MSTQHPRYGPYENACGYCGASLLTGHKDMHVKWHEKIEPELKRNKGEPGTPVKFPPESTPASV